MWLPHYLRSPALDGSGVATDPYFSSVTLLVGNDNAANGSTTITDQSSLALTLTAIGNAAYSNAQAPTGMTTSIAFDGAGDAIRLAVNAGLTLSGDFTIECYLRQNANSGDALVLGYDELIRNRQARVNQSSVAGRYSMFDGAANPISSAAGSSWNNAWRHTAYCRSGTSLYFLQDGSQIGTTGTNSGSFDFSGLLVGAGATAGTPNGLMLNGWIACLRVTKGVARYTGAYTPPTLPLPTS